MANASTKRIAAANEKALQNLQLGLLGVNVSTPSPFLNVSLSKFPNLTDCVGCYLGTEIHSLPSNQSIVPPFRIPFDALHSLHRRFCTSLEMVL